MPFGYEYWMVFLPDYHPASFLLFDFNQAGSTKLRLYTADSVEELGAPTERAVRKETEFGRTRFDAEPHPTTDISHWYQVTMQKNQKYQGVIRAAAAGAPGIR